MDIRSVRYSGLVRQGAYAGLRGHMSGVLWVLAGLRLLEAGRSFARDGDYGLGLVGLNSYTLSVPIG